MKDIFQCTQCGVDLKEVRVKISTHLIASRKIPTNNLFEDIYNSEVINYEYLCTNCFNLFVDNLDKFKGEN